MTYLVFWVLCSWVMFKLLTVKWWAPENASSEEPIGSELGLVVGVDGESAYPP